MYKILACDRESGETGWLMKDGSFVAGKRAADVFATVLFAQSICDAMECEIVEVVKLGE